jgi:hypothetical protein
MKSVTRRFFIALLLSVPALALRGSQELEGREGAKERDEKRRRLEWSLAERDEEGQWTQAGCHYLNEALRDEGFTKQYSLSELQENFRAQKAEEEKRESMKRNATAFALVAGFGLFVYNFFGPTK